MANNRLIGKKIYTKGQLKMSVLLLFLCRKMSLLLRCMHIRSIKTSNKLINWKEQIIVSLFALINFLTIIILYFFAVHETIRKCCHCRKFLVMLGNTIDDTKIWVVKYIETPKINKKDKCMYCLLLLLHRFTKKYDKWNKIK